MDPSTVAVDSARFDRTVLHEPRPVRMRWWALLPTRGEVSGSTPDTLAARADLAHWTELARGGPRCGRAWVGHEPWDLLGCRVLPLGPAPGAALRAHRRRPRATHAASRNDSPGPGTVAACSTSPVPRSIAPSARVWRLASHTARGRHGADDARPRGHARTPPPAVASHRAAADDRRPRRRRQRRRLAPGARPAGTAIRSLGDALFWTSTPAPDRLVAAPQPALAARPHPRRPPPGVRDLDRRHPGRVARARSSTAGPWRRRARRSRSPSVTAERPAGAQRGERGPRPRTALP